MVSAGKHGHEQLFYARSQIAAAYTHVRAEWAGDLEGGRERHRMAFPSEDGVYVGGIVGQIQREAVGCVTRFALRG
jgi:hypothetical protein